jgi:hypothetical protein
MHIRTLHVLPAGLILLLLVLMHDHQICVYHIILTDTTGLAVHHARTYVHTSVQFDSNLFFWGTCGNVFVFILLLALIVVALKQGRHTPSCYGAYHAYVAQLHCSWSWLAGVKSKLEIFWFGTCDVRRQYRSTPAGYCLPRT